MSRAQQFLHPLWITMDGALGALGLYALMVSCTHGAGALAIESAVVSGDYFAVQQMEAWSLW